MAILYILIPVVLVFICFTVAFFLWAVHNNQFEDLEHQGHNILFDDDIENPQYSSQTSIKPPSKLPSHNND